MVRDVQIDDTLSKKITQKILQIEKTIEEENGRIKLNRMPARYFMFFFVIGGEDESCVILERKVKALLSNPDACEFLQITKCDNSENYGAEIEKVLKDAASNRIDVQDLNTVFLCPVIFANNDMGSDVLPVLTKIDSFMNSSGREAVWQPTVIIKREVSEYKNIYFTVSEIERFITAMPEGKVNRCCLLSNLDEKGFDVPKESIMQTIAMVVVLQNVITESAGNSQALRSKVKWSSSAADSCHLFFTARNAAVTNPKRSLLLQRMCSVIDFFLQKNTENSVMSRINYSFVSQIMSKYIQSLPHHAGKITLFPLYSVMSDNSLHKQLEKIIKEKYYEPLCGEKVRKEQIDKATDMFLEKYFSENGSLENLKMLIKDNSIEREFLQHKRDCYTTVQIEEPPTDKKKLYEFQGGDYEQARIYCERLITDSGWELLEAVKKQLLLPDMARSVEAVQDFIDSIKKTYSRADKTIGICGNGFGRRRSKQMV